MLSLCLENAELKERMGEATLLLESGEPEEAGLGSSLAPEPRRLQRKSRSTLGDRRAGGSVNGQGVPAERAAVPARCPVLEAQSQDDVLKRPCPGTLGRGNGSHVSALGPGDRDGDDDDDDDGGGGELTTHLPCGRWRAWPLARAGRGWARSCARRWCRAKGSARSCRTNSPPRKPLCGHKPSSWRSTTSYSVSSNPGAGWGGRAEPGAWCCVWGRDGEPCPGGHPELTGLPGR